MTIQNTKIILFASLIIAMVLPFSGMNTVYAEESLEEKQTKLLDKLTVIEEKIINTYSEKKIQKLEAQKQLIFEELFNNAGEPNNKITKYSSEISEEYTNISGTSNFNINGSHKGCDDANETWNFKGTMTGGSSWVSIQQAFPIQLTSGIAPSCSSWNWENNVYLEMRDLFDTDKGCRGNLITAPVTSYSVNCQTPIQGLWIVKVTADYEFNQVSGFTIVGVL